MDEAAAQRNANQLDGLVEETSALSSQLKTRVKNLQKKGGSGRDGQIRKQQVRLTVSQISRCSDRRLCTHLVDGPSQAKVCRGDSELPTSGAAIPLEVQAAHGAPVQDWWVQPLC